jgi:hypothetical protein
MVVKLYVSQYGRNIDGGYFREGCRGEYFDLRGRKWLEPGEDCIAQSLIILRYTKYYGDQINEDDRGGTCSKYGEIRNTHNILVVKSEGKRPFGRPRRRWEDNIRLDLGGIGWEGVDLMHMDQDRDQWLALVNTVMNLRVL